MDENFEIPVHFAGREEAIAARLLVQGYSYKIETDVQGRKVFFERDEEGAFRALLPPDSDGAKEPPVALLEAIATSLTTIFS